MLSVREVLMHWVVRPGSSQCCLTGRLTPHRTGKLGAGGCPYDLREGGNWAVFLSLKVMQSEFAKIIMNRR
ncbi:hypothetical protein CEB3_c05270 [Peptococcaceae bacterium CEB3]|nr:hypothetical protein CEB3_c05270 [Peptococcaceae bacterium CEB3]